MARARRRKQQRPSTPNAPSTPSPSRSSQGQVGRRPSRPGLLLVVGIMWIAAGVIELFALDANWRFVPAIVFVGIGLFFIRGAAVTVNRREGDQSA